MARLASSAGRKATCRGNVPAEEAAVVPGEVVSIHNHRLDVQRS